MKKVVKKQEARWKLPATPADKWYLVLTEDNQGAIISDRDVTGTTVRIPSSLKGKIHLLELNEPPKGTLVGKHLTTSQLHRAVPAAFEALTTDSLRWVEFVSRLGGPEGCNFKQLDPNDPLKVSWTCKGGTDQSLARQILTKMGLSKANIAETLRYCSETGGHCDCEILFNTDRDGASAESSKTSSAA
jgi:hypothetical protein